MKKVIKWAFIIALFAICQHIAFSQRGYYAIGGEIFVIVIPVWVSIYKALLNRYCK